MQSPLHLLISISFKSNQSNNILSILKRTYIKRYFVNLVYKAFQIGLMQNYRKREKPLNTKLVLMHLSTICRVTDHFENDLISMFVTMYLPT